MVRNVLALGLVLGAASCDTWSGTCMEATRALCEACPKDDYDQVVCTCVEEGTLTIDDVPDGIQWWFDVETNADAERMCATIHYDLQYPSDDAAAECKQSLEYVKDYDNDACEDLGWGG